MPPIPLFYHETEDFWRRVRAREPSNLGHARNLVGHGPIVGTIGEIAFEMWCETEGLRIQHEGTTEFDYLLHGPTSGKLRTIEVKTKLRSRWDDNAWQDWEMSVPDYLLQFWKKSRFTPSVLVAVSVQSRVVEPRSVADVDGIVVVGAISYRAWSKLPPAFIPEGTTMGGGQSSPANMWNIALKHLQSVARLRDA